MERFVRPRPSALAWVNVGFATITLMVIALVIADFRLSEGVQARTVVLVENTTRSIELVASMNMALADLHSRVRPGIHDRDPAALEELARHRRRVAASFRTLSSSYRPLVIYPRESETWGRLENSWTAYLQILARVEVLARAGDEAGAETLVDDALAATRDRAALAAAQLIRINALEAHALGQRIEGAHLRATSIDVGIGVVVLLVVLVIRRLVSSRLAREEDQHERYVSLLSERNRDLDGFASRLAHDLKGLVGPITGYADLLREDPSQADKVRRYAERIGRKTEEIVALVEELLRLSRAGRPSRGPTEPLPLVRTLVEEHEAEIAAANAVVDVVVQCPPLECSEVALREVLDNLFTNALKYRSPERPARIRLELREMQGRGEVLVVDNGVGMSPAALARVGEPFFRGGARREVPGSGLGVAIVRRIVEVHGGETSIESVEGQGTTVRVTLPLWTALRETVAPRERRWGFLRPR